MQLTSKELTAVANLLRQAKASCENVRDLFFDGLDIDASARFAEIAMRISDERDRIERMIASTGTRAARRNKPSGWHQARLPH